MTQLFKSICNGLTLALCLLLAPPMGHAAPATSPTKTSTVGQKPIVLQTMGSLFFGGTHTISPQGETFHGDHGYANFYVPATSRNLPLIMWHGIGQSGKTYESTPDGREGFQAILTRRDWSVYIIDQPRRGRAGRTDAPMAEHIVPTTMRESSAWNAFRLGIWTPPTGPNFYPNVRFPQDGYTINQFFRQQTPDTGAEPRTAEHRAFMGRTVGELFVATGPGILITHSNSGQYGWETGMAQPELVKAIVAYEPGAFVFPEGEALPDVITKAEGVKEALEPRFAPMESFKKLTKMPILVVYGDNIATEPSHIFNVDVWRVASTRAAQFVAAVNRHGGDAQLVLLPKIGITGNTHIPFADLNNVEIASHLETWLRAKKLDGRDKGHTGPQKKVMELTVPLGKKS